MRSASLAVAHRRPVVRTCALAAILLLAARCGCEPAYGDLRDRHVGLLFEAPLGEVSRPDLQYVDGVLSTIDDGIATTPGDQQSELWFYRDVIDVPSTTAVVSFTLSGLTPVGPAIIGPGLVRSQDFFGGEFALYSDQAPYELLLSGAIASIKLRGSDTTSIGSLHSLEGDPPVLPPALGQFTGGSLLPLLPANVEFLLSVTVSSVQSASGIGLDVDGEGSQATLRDFTAHGIVYIDVFLPAVPEPGTLLGALVGCCWLGHWSRQRMNR